MTLTVVPTQFMPVLAPTFTISPLATISPASGNTQNFTSSVTYTVTAQNGATQSYSVAVQSYDTGAHSGAHSTEAWFRTSAVNCEVVDWGVEGGTGAKVQIRVVSPPRIYVDGQLDASENVTMNLPNPSRIWIGGW